MLVLTANLLWYAACWIRNAAGTVNRNHATATRANPKIRNEWSATSARELSTRAFPLRSAWLRNQNVAARMQNI